MGVFVRFLRYWLYLLFLGAVVGGGLALLPLLRGLGLGIGAPTTKALVTLLVFAAIPVAKGLKSDLSSRPAQIEGGSHNYLAQESTWTGPAAADWKARLKETVNGIIFEGRAFVLELEEEDFLAYRSERNRASLEKRRKRRSENRMIVEAEGLEDGSLCVMVRKERQYVELSNRDNEELLALLVHGMQAPREVGGGGEA